VVEIDAQIAAPTALLLLTTRSPADCGETFTKGLEQVARALRRRWSDTEYLAFIEFTTGTATTSGGARRMHAHVLLKGVPAADLPAAETVATRVWKRRMGSTKVTCEPIRSVPALVNYLANSHRKPNQLPPPWWRGKCVRPSRGYFHRPISDLRCAARRHLSAERRSWFESVRRRSAAHGRDLSVQASAPGRAADGGWRLAKVRESARHILTPAGLMASEELADTRPLERPQRATSALPLPRLLQASNVRPTEAPKGPDCQSQDCRGAPTSDACGGCSRSRHPP
jgi:hypothetical protein